MPVGQKGFGAGAGQASAGQQRTSRRRSQAAEAYSVLDAGRAALVLGGSMPPWQKDLTRYEV
ncbi:hypothetical protein DFAR_2480006 [Desulfarculales bacterium]